jgi:DNA-binding transcriptional ArsR family regulator
MRPWQVIKPLLPSGIGASATDDEMAVLIRSAAGAQRLFHVAKVERLTRPWVEGNRLAEHPDEGWLVLYGQASSDAREALRARGISYAGEEDGRLFVVGPGLHVERDDRVPPESAPWQASQRDRVRNPFAVGASRVPRWLLLHPGEALTIKDVAAVTELSESVVSRTVGALDDDALVEVGTAREDARRRLVRIARPRAVLAAWARERERRRVRWVSWSIGARDAHEATELLSSVSGRPVEPGWMIGGVAGAALLQRLVEPSDVVVWARRDAVERLAALLRPRVERQPGPGMLRVAVARDDWIFGLAQDLDGVAVADPVQLWLDCAAEGERALEAAEAIAGEMRW